MFKVEKKTLLFVAGVVWFAAGFNIGRIGVIAAGGQWPIWIIALALLIFIVFRKMVFGKLVVKHTARIKGYEGEKHSIFKFFDKQAYLIMAFMMTFGIGLRVSGLVPDWFIAFFYTGLGTALLLAGIEFFIQFVKYHKELKTADGAAPEVSAESPADGAPVEQIADAAAPAAEKAAMDSTKGDYPMKKYMNFALGYLIAALAGGVFYREFTKFYAFDGRTTLAFVHPHLLFLGTGVFLLLALFARQIDFEGEKAFGVFKKVYNIGLPLTVVMLVVRGIVQVQGNAISAGASAAISGIAGIGHILLAVGLISLMVAWRNAAGRADAKTAEIK